MFSFGALIRLSGRPTPTGRTVGMPRSATTGCIGPVAGMNGQRTGSPYISRTDSMTDRATAELAALLDLGVDAGHHAAVRLGGLHDLVVKAFDLDVHVLVAQARQRADEVHRGGWIDGREAGVLVEVELLDTQVDIEQAAAPELQRRPARVVKRSARLPQTSVSAQLGGVVVRDLLKGLGPDLLLALDQEPQRDR